MNHSKNRRIEGKVALITGGGSSGDAWDVANAALWLASSESRYVKGAEIMVDGGLTARFA